MWKVVTVVTGRRIRVSNEINLCLKSNDAERKVLPLKDREKKTLWAMIEGTLEVDGIEFMTIKLPRHHKRFVIRSSLGKNGDNSYCRRIESAVITGDDRRYACHFGFYNQNDEEKDCLVSGAYEVSLKHDLFLVKNHGNNGKVLAPAGTRLPIETSYYIKSNKQKTKKSKGNMTKRMKVADGEYVVRLGDRQILSIIPLSSIQSTIFIKVHRVNGYPMLCISLVANIWGGEAIISAKFNMQRLISFNPDT